MLHVNGNPMDPILHSKTDTRTPQTAPSFRERLGALIRSRKSIRQYRTRNVPEDLLQRVLESGLHAPSGKNSQNWRFFVVTGEKRDAYLKLSQKAWLLQKDSLQKRLKPSLYRFTERFFFTLGNAPVVIFAYAAQDPDVHEKSVIGAIYMALENIILSAQAEGLGTCTMGAPLKIREDIDAFLDIPGHEKQHGEKLELVCSLVMGWPDHDPPKSPRKLERRITWVK